MTTSKTFDVTAIGNAIVDVIAQADDALLAAFTEAARQHGPPDAERLDEAVGRRDAKAPEDQRGCHGKKGTGYFFGCTTAAKKVPGGPKK